MWCMEHHGGQLGTVARQQGLQGFLQWKDAFTPSAAAEVMYQTGGERVSYLPRDWIAPTQLLPMPARFLVAEAERQSRLSGGNVEAKIEEFLQIIKEMEEVELQAGIGKSLFHVLDRLVNKLSSAAKQLGEPTRIG